MQGRLGQPLPPVPRSSRPLTGPAALSAVVSLDQQRRKYRPAFAGQHVVSAAGGAQIHGFHADAGLDQRTVQLRMGKPQTAAAAKDHELGLQVPDALEMLLGQVLQTRQRPSLHLALPRHEQAAAVFHAVDPDALAVMPGDGVAALRLVELKFH